MSRSKRWRAVQVLGVLCWAFWPTAWSQEQIARETATSQATRPVEELDVEAWLADFVAQLNPPTVEEILKSLEPIPTLEECLAPLPDHPNAPWKRTLTDNEEAHLGSLEAEVSALCAAGCFAEAAREAREIAAVREGAQGTNHWETADARRRAETLSQLAALDRASLLMWREAERQKDESTRLLHAAEHQEALRSAMQALTIQWRLLRENHSSVATSLNNLAAALYENGDYDTAELLHREAFRQRRSSLGPSHPHVGESLNNLAVVLHDKGERARSEILHRAALACRRDVRGHKHPEVAESLNNLGLLIGQRGDSAAPELLGQALAIWRSAYGNEHAHVAACLANLSSLLYVKGDYAAAEPLLRESLAIDQTLYGPEHPSVAMDLHNLAALHHAKGEYDTAEELYHKALVIKRKTLGNGHPAVASGLRLLAQLLQATGDFSAAEPLCREALAIARSSLGDGHPDYAQSLTRLALLREAQGDYAAAETFLREALEINHKIFGDEHPEFARSLRFLADTLDAKGDYASAEPMYRQALEIHRRAYGSKSPDVAIGLNNLALLLYAVGDYEAAEPLYREALAIRAHSSGHEHPEYALGLNNLAAVLQAKEDYEAAEPLYRQALQICRRAYGNDHPTVATSLHNLAELSSAMGAHKEAEILYQEALGILEESLGDEHPLVSQNLRHIAQLLHTRGDYTGAASRLYEALRIAEARRTRIIGAERERAAFAAKLSLPAISAALGEVLVRLGRNTEAFSVVERGCSRALLDLLMRSERDLIAEADETRGVKEEALKRALKTEDDARIAVSAAERRLAATQARGDLGEHKAELLAKQRAEITQLRRRLRSAEAAVLVELREMIPAGKPLSAEKITNDLSPGEILLNYVWAQHAVYVLMVEGAAERVAEDAHVRGQVLADGTDEVEELARLVMEGRFALTRRALSRAGTLDQKLSQLSVRLLPDEVSERVMSAARVVVIADGPLYGIPLEALVLSHGGATKGEQEREQLLLAAGPVFVYTPSATVYLNRRRERLARAQNTRAAADSPSILALGSPIFDQAKHARPEYPRQGVMISMVGEGTNADQAGLCRGDVLLTYDGESLADFEDLVAKLGIVRAEVDAGERNVNEKVSVTYWRDGKLRETRLQPGRMGVQLDRDSPADALEFLTSRSRGEGAKIAEISALDQIRLHGGLLRPLPGTEKEAKAIAELFKFYEPGSEGVTILVGRDATLGRLEQEVSGKRYVHLATHGLTGTTERPYDASLALTQPVIPTPEDIGFLTLDHLIRRWRGKLEACELVVLSACDTQRGVLIGDSMMALPWGFFYAGAPTVVASLWKVDDSATALLMIRFYENLLGKFEESREVPGRVYASGQAMSKAVALREAKLWLRSRTPDQNRRALKRIGTRGFLDGQKAGEDALVELDFSDPYYWAAFVLIGDPS